MKLKLKIWRQKNTEEKGHLVDYDIENISPDMSFLEIIVGDRFLKSIELTPRT